VYVTKIEKQKDPHTQPLGRVCDKNEKNKKTLTRNHWVVYVVKIEKQKDT